MVENFHVVSKHLFTKRNASHKVHDYLQTKVNKMSSITKHCAIPVLFNLHVVVVLCVVLKCSSINVDSHVH